MHTHHQQSSSIAALSVTVNQKSSVPILTTHFIMLVVHWALFSTAHLAVGDRIGAGAFGSVHEATFHGGPCVAKCASAGKRAEQFLTVEAHANQMLVARGTGQTPPCLAHYRGEHTLDGCRWLVWDRCGGIQPPRTLDDFLRADGDVDAAAQGLSQLAEILGCSPSELPGLVLRCTLTALAYVHALGVVHRDVKPENLLVDPVRRALVLIDFGSSCDAAGWVVKTGLERDRVPCSVLYCPPEQLLSIDAPYTYDVYSAALIWLRVALPALAASEEVLPCCALPCPAAVPRAYPACIRACIRACMPCRVRIPPLARALAVTRSPHAPAGDAGALPHAHGAQGPPPRHRRVACSRGGGSHAASRLVARVCIG